MRPSSAHHHAPKKIRPQQKGRRSAERRMCQPYPRSSDKRRRLPMLQRGCAPLSGARPPSGASPRHSPPATTPMAQPQNRVSAKYGAQVFCPFAAHALCVKHAPCGPVLLPVDRCPRAARERIAFTSARGHRVPLPSSESALAKGALGASGFCMRNPNEDACQARKSQKRRRFLNLPARDRSKACQSYRLSSGAPAPLSSPS